MLREESERSEYHDFLSTFHVEMPTRLGSALSGYRPSQDELELQLMWYSGEYGNKFQTTDGQKLRVLDFGRWNRSAGPDFLRATIEVNGEVSVGDIEIDLSSESWERHGHAVNSNFNQVVLHVSAKVSKSQFFYRREDLSEVPFSLVLEEQEEHSNELIETEAFNAYFKKLSDSEIEVLLKKASRHRAFLKYRKMSRKAEHLSEESLLFEAFSDVLGYSQNQQAMKALAHRVGKRRLELAHPESVFLGAAGLLNPEIHRKAPVDTKPYLEALWEDWWSVRQQYELDDCRQSRWNRSGMRPANHYHRRIATLGLMVAELELLLADFKKESPRDLIQRLGGINHPFWSAHYSLKSQKLLRAQKLWGASRIQAFLINYWYPLNIQKQEAEVWFMKQRLSFTSEKVKSNAVRLFGRSLAIKYAWQEQGLLQLGADFLKQ